MGAGCTQLDSVTDGFKQDREVAGDWYLNFDLPSDWIMTETYDDVDDMAVTPGREIDGDLNEIYLQDTDKAIVFGGTAVDAAVPADAYVTADHTRILVSRLDSHRSIPDEATDLKDGFFSVPACDEGEDCTANGSDSTEYYFKTDEGLYRFETMSNAPDKDKAFKQAKDIILSAEEVTQLNGEAERTEAAQ